MTITHLEVDLEDLYLLHRALDDQRHVATRDGAVWSHHQRNAQLRTRIERAAHDLDDPPGHSLCVRFPGQPTLTLDTFDTRDEAEEMANDYNRAHSPFRPTYFTRPAT